MDQPPIASSSSIPPEPSKPTTEPQLSKNAQKRAAKAALAAQFKLERRARDKEKKMERKRAQAEKHSAGESLGEGNTRGRKRAKTTPACAGEKFGARVVVDLGFDELMSEKEIVSLCSQLAYVYSTNRRAAFPFSLLYTSLNGRTLARLEILGDASYKRWVDTEWWKDGYERLWAVDSEDPASATDQDPDGRARGSRTTRESVVYLTADSQDELTELKPDETYIIGGICDHNRYKNLCLTKSQATCIRSARLPIGRYLSSLPTRKVLTVNQVFEILVKWVETRSWEDAFYAVIPKRKFQGVQPEKKIGGGVTDDDGLTGAELVVDEPEEHEVHHQLILQEPVAEDEANDQSQVM